MPDHKNQHYVPQHYLKSWSTEDYIQVYHLDQGEVPSTHISKVCSKDYLYGQPSDVEIALGRLEKLHNKPLSNLRDGANLTDLSGTDLKLLLSFIMTQRTRSKFTQEDIEAGEHVLREGIQEDMVNDRYENYVEWKEELSSNEKVESMLEASILGIHFRHMMLGVLGYYTIQDLDAVMLRNLTDNKFLLSDVPPVFDNPRFSSRVVAGIGRPGLQIFCPIDPTRLLLLYDPNIYTIDKNSQQEVIIKSQSVIDELNLLQYHNAENVILHGGNDESYLNRLSNRLDDVRRREQITQNHEVDGTNYEVDKIPPYQTPKISPSIPGQSINYGVQYQKTRPGSKIKHKRRIIKHIMNESGGFPDVGLIMAIQLLKAMVEASD